MNAGVSTKEMLSVRCMEGTAGPTEEPIYDNLRYRTMMLLVTSPLDRVRKSLILIATEFYKTFYLSAPE